MRITLKFDSRTDRVLIATALDSWIEGSDEPYLTEYLTGVRERVLANDDFRTGRDDADIETISNALENFVWPDSSGTSHLEQRDALLGDLKPYRIDNLPRA